MSKVVCVCNHKGGVGKTTITANVGFSFSRNFKVLLVDVDPQCNLSTGLGVKDGKENVGTYLKEIIHSRYPSVIPVKINNYVDIIAGDIQLLEIENLLHHTAPSEFILEKIINQVKSKYDLVLLDCPPSFNLLTINALQCSDLILIPTKPEQFSIDGIRLVENFASENHIPFKIIFNQVNTRLLLHRQNMSVISGKFNGNTCVNSIRNSISLAEAFGHAKDIFHYKNKSIGATDFVNLSGELMSYF